MKILLSVLMMFVATAASAAEELTSKEAVAAAFAKGRPMIIMFYTTWCGACKVTQPEFAKAEKELAGKVDFYLMDADKLRLKMKKDFDSIPSFVAGSTEKAVRSARSLSSGSMKAAAIKAYVLRFTGVR